MSQKNFILIVVLSAFFIASCSNDKKQEDQNKIEQVVARIESGELVEQINKANDQNMDVEHKNTHDLLRTEIDDDSILLNTVISQDIPADIPVIEKNTQQSADLTQPLELVINENNQACLQIPSFNEKQFLSEKNKADLLTLFSRCLGELGQLQNIYQVSLNYFKNFEHKNESKPWSDLSLGEMVDWILKRNLSAFLVQLLPQEDQKALRFNFSDDDILELKKLRDTRKYQIVFTIDNLSQVIEGHKGLKNLLIESRDLRFYVLLALLEAHKQPESLRSAFLVQALDQIIPLGDLLTNVKNLDRVNPGYLQEVQNLFYPYVFLSTLPKSANPVQVVLNEMDNHLEGSDKFLEVGVESYKNVRNFKQLPFKAQLDELSAETVKVVVVDTGIDFVSFPDLGVFLSDGKEGRVKTFDYADRITNPFVPSLSSLTHGSGTSATVLTVVSKLNSEVLKQRKVDLGFWKVWSTSGILAGWPKFTHPSWDVVKIPVFEAIYDSIKKTKDSQKPDIVSMSLGFGTKDGLEAINEKDLLLKAPWLWVMAAGNSSEEVLPPTVKRKPLGPPSCFIDVPEAQRPVDQILCIGALKRAEPPLHTEERIAAYSNFGENVDVYAYESYIKLCPSGTSCSTPAVTGAAVLLKAEIPSLTPSEIKRIIIEASTEKTLFVENRNGQSNEVKRVVRVFDPETDYVKALEIALKLKSVTLD